MSNSEPEYVLIAASSDDRDGLSDALVKAGFELLDTSGTRVLFADGDYDEFLKTAKRWAKNGGTLTRVIRITDPGLGICLDYPEDGPMNQKGLVVSHSWASI